MGHAYSCIEAVHNRMCRFYLGVNKYTPNAAVRGDMGLRVPWHHQHIELARQWSKLVNMSGNRINKVVFQWANNTNGKTWIKYFREFLHKCRLEKYINTNNIEKKSFLQEINECLEIRNTEK